MSFGEVTKRHQTKHAKITTGFVFAMLLVLGSGCDRGWLAYQQIELGRPLSADHLLLGEGSNKDGIKGWGERAVNNIPPIIAGDSVAVGLDAEGNVMVKRYYAVALGFWGLFQTVAVRSVMEVEVPRSPFPKRPPSSHATRYSPTELGGYLELLEWRLHQGSTRPQQDPMQNCSIWASMWFFYAAHHIHGCSEPFSVCAEDVIDKYPGLMNQGYDFRYRDVLGRYYRIRNIGGRRIRIECSSFRIADPLGALLVISGPPSVTVDTGTTDKQTKTEIESDEENR